jgi:hypothetical protein
MDYGVLSVPAAGAACCDDDGDRAEQRLAAAAVNHGEAGQVDEHVCD